MPDDTPTAAEIAEFGDPSENAVVLDSDGECTDAAEVPDDFEEADDE